MYLLPENVSRQDGCGAEIELEAVRGKPLLLTLGITRAAEQQSIEISVWGSAGDGQWQCVTVFPRKYYCGAYLHLLDLRRYPEISHVRVQWAMSRWGSSEEPLFGFHLMADETKLKTAGAA